MLTSDKIRNVAVIAHVDHGKTTVVDALLKQSNTFRDNQLEMQSSLIMDSGDQERERGITIKAKQTAVEYDDYRINIVDTPGHADFSGEVERVLNMADGCLLIVDAAEGPMPQTKFVLNKAIELNLKPIVIINKIDKANSRINEVEEEILELFLELSTNDSHLEYKTIYSIAKLGKSWDELPSDTNDNSNFEPVFKAIIDQIPAPKIEASDEVKLLIAASSYDSYQGKYAIGKLSSGKLLKGAKLNLFDSEKLINQFTINKVYHARGLGIVEIESAIAGDIVQITGLNDFKIGNLISSSEVRPEIKEIKLTPPTIQITLAPNSSPVKGLEGKFTTSRQIEERLDLELETNLGLNIEKKDTSFKIAGRGELHLSVLIENLRREGFEFEVSKPEVILRDIDGVLSEPVESLEIEVPEQYIGVIQSALGSRKATIVSQHQKLSQTILTYNLPTRAIIGLRNELMTATKGTVILNSYPIGMQKYSGALPKLRNGALIAFEAGSATAYALQTVWERGVCFISPTDKVYAGQVIGLNNRQEDIEINVCKGKQLTNMRSKSSDGTIQLPTTIELSLEQAIDFLENDELLEVTPKSLRIRKKILDHNARKRVNKN